MADAELIEFDPDSGLAREYLSLIRRIHAEDPTWVAPPERATVAALSRNSFFHNPNNHFRGFALRRNDELVGHVLATVHHAHRDQAGAPVGALGFLEVEPDYELFRLLVHSALDWLRDNAGASRARATMNFDIWQGYRVMTRGFALPPFLGEPRNGPWLPEFLMRAGFERCKGWVSATTSREFLIGRTPYFRDRYETALADGYRIGELKVRAPAQIEKLHHLVTSSFSGFYAYTPIEEAAFASLVGRFLRITGTELASVLEDPVGQTVGFSIAYPDPMPLLERMDGHDGWLSRWRALFPPRPERALHFMIGVLPEARAAHPGLGSALMYATLSRILAAGYPQTTFALMADDSPARYFAMDQAETAEREYALFERSLQFSP